MAGDARQDELLAEGRRLSSEAAAAQRRILAAVDRRGRRRRRSPLVLWLRIFVPMLIGILIGIEAHAWWMSRGR